MTSSMIASTRSAKLEAFALFDLIFAGGLEGSEFIGAAAWIYLDHVKRACK
jgi:hypothetical protein